MGLSEEGRAILKAEDIGPDSVERALSMDAQRVGAAWFGMMRPDGELTFHMRESRPTARAQAALDELTEAGLIYRETEKSGAVSYRPIWNFHILFVKHARWISKGPDADDPIQLVEPILKS